MIIGYIDPGTGYVLGSGLTNILVAACAFSLFFVRRIWFFFKRPPFFIIMILLILGFGSYALVKDKKEGLGEYHYKIIILGFDGLSPKITERLMREGKLPNFLKLEQMGSYRSLATTNPPQSPVAWSSFATGKNPGKHDVFDFIVRDPRDYNISLSLSDVQRDKPKSVLKAKGFWWYATQKKIPSIILGCPLTFPPEKIDGRMLSGMGVPDIRGTEGTFSYYTTERVFKMAEMGNITWVNKSPAIISYFWGPQYSSFLGRVVKSKVQFTAFIDKDSQSARVEYQGKQIELRKGQWSEWHGITFDVGLLRKVDGILRMYLIEAGPEFKLYVSPINFDPRHPLYPISYPPEYSREIAERNGLFYTQGIPFESWGVNEGLLSENPFLVQVNQAFVERKNLLDFELGRFKKGILYCYFGMPDIIQHMFWRYIDPGHPLYDANEAIKYGGVIDQWYERMDGVLGDAMKSIGKDDTIIVLSDHGFDTFRRAVHINSWLRDHDYMVMKDSTSTRGAPLFADVDWSKTKAYALGFGGIYINQQGRERDGIVPPGEETEELKTEIIQKMQGWTDGDNNEAPVIRRIYRNQEIYWGDYSKNAPDLFVGFNVGYGASWQTALGGAPSESIEDNLKKWSGSHLFDPVLVPGIFLTNKKIMKVNPSLCDITPTILKLIGYSDQEMKAFDFDGNALFN